MKKYAASLILLTAFAGFATVSVLAIVYALPRRAFTLGGVQRVAVVGNHLLSAREVLACAGFPTQPYQQRLLPSKLEANLRAHRLIAGARVRRSGRTVVFFIRELQPYFRLLVGADKYWLCRDGSVLPMDTERDFGPVFDELRRQVSVRLAGAQLVEDPEALALAVKTAMQVESIAPHRFAEMRVDLNQRYQLAARSGLIVDLGESSDLADKVDVLGEALRAAGSASAPVRRIEYLDSTHVVLKKAVF